MEPLREEIQAVDNEALSQLRARSKITRVGAQSVSAGARNGLVWWGVSGWLLRYGARKDREAAIDGALGWGFAQLVGYGLKHAVHRRRPTTGEGKQPKSPSMPSTHTTNAVAYTVAAGIRAPQVAIPCAAIAATIAWSRLALNRHFPTDVLAGVSLGTAVGVSVAVAHRAYDQSARLGRGTRIGRSPLERRH
jgi:undecaprenyl-diphosphatase